MRPLPLFLVILLLPLQLVRCAGSDGGDDSDATVDGFTDKSTGSKDGSAFVRPVSQFPPAVLDTSANFRDGLVLPPPPSELPIPHPELVRLPRTRQGRPMGSRTASEPIEPAVRGPDAPPPHPMLAPKRAREAEKGKGKLRRARLDEVNADEQGSDSPAGSEAPPQRVEAEGRKRTLRRPKMKQTEAASSRPAVEYPIVPPVQADGRIHHPVILPGIPIEQGAEDMQRAAAASAAPDSFLTRLFQSYRPVPQQGANMQLPAFSQNGLRYGHIPAQPPVMDATAPIPAAEIARVLLPQDVRWVFTHTHHRQRAYEIARDTSNQILVRKTMADEAKRLYDMEARNLRLGIDNRNELALYTSDEWRRWISEHGIRVLMSELDPFRLKTPNIVTPTLLDARYRLAIKLQTSHLSTQEVIALQGEQEKWAANFLVAWWTSAHDEMLKAGLEHVR